MSYNSYGIFKKTVPTFVVGEEYTCDNDNRYKVVKVQGSFTYFHTTKKINSSQKSGDVIYPFTYRLIEKDYAHGWSVAKNLVRATPLNADSYNRFYL